jgi:hypothetical protein
MLTCAQRQCDERRPGCTPCLRLGKGPCPGYRFNNKFVDEGARLKQKQATRINPPTNISLVSPAKNQQIQAFVHQPLTSPIMADEKVRRGFEVMMRTHIPIVHCGRMDSCLDILSGTPAMHRTLQNSPIMPSYVIYIPQRMGHSRVLDSAIDVVFSAAGALVSLPTEGARLELIRKYGASLKYLHDSILDPEQSMTAEVLAAASLLSCYEASLSFSEVAGLG